MCGIDRPRQGPHLTWKWVGEPDLATRCSLAGHRKARGRGEGSVGEGGEGQEGEEVSLLWDEGHRHDHDGGGGGGDEKKDEEKS